MKFVPRKVVLGKHKDEVDWKLVGQTLTLSAIYAFFAIIVALGMGWLVAQIVLNFSAFTLLLFLGGLGGVVLIYLLLVNWDEVRDASRT